MYYLYPYAPSIIQLQLGLDQLKFIMLLHCGYMCICKKTFLWVGDPGSAADFRTNVQGKGRKGHGLYRPGLLSLQITPNGSPW